MLKTLHAECKKARRPHPAFAEASRGRRTLIAIGVATSPRHSISLSGPVRLRQLYFLAILLLICMFYADNDRLLGSVSMDSATSAATLKEEGNRAFVGKDYDTALLKYDEALRSMGMINLSDGDRKLQAVMHTNKSACNASLKKSVLFPFNAEARIPSSYDLPGTRRLQVMRKR